MRAIAAHEGVADKTIYKIVKKIQTHGSPTTPPVYWQELGRKMKLSSNDEDALVDELVSHGWMYQDGIVDWLFVERGIHLSRSRVSRLLQRKQWSRRTLRPFSSNRSKELGKLIVKE